MGPDFDNSFARWPDITWADMNAKIIKEEKPRRLK